MLKNYLFIAARFLAKSKVFTAINVVGLVSGITSFILIALYVTDEVTYDRQHTFSERIYRVVNHAPENDPWLKGMPQFPEQMMSEVPEIENYSRLLFSRGLVQMHEKSFEEKRVAYADNNFFKLFTFELVYGAYSFRDQNSVILTENTALKYFGSEDPIGQQIQFTIAEDTVSSEFTVTGIIKNLPSNHHFHFDVLLPYREGMSVQNNIGVYSYFLLKSDASSAVVESKFKALNEKHFEAWRTDLTQSISLQPITSIHLDSHFGEEIEANGNKGVVYILGCTAFLILSIALINYINISLARSTKRAKEVGIRKTLGAFRHQLVSQFLMESLIVLTVSAVISLGFVQLILPLFNSFTQKTIDVGFYEYVPILAGVILFSGVLASSYPAFLLSGVLPTVILKDTTSLGFLKGTRLRGILLTSQFCIAMMLLMITFTIWQQLDFLQKKELGFEKEHIIVINLNNPELQRQYESVKRKLNSYPEITNVAASGTVPGGDFPGWPYQLPIASSPSGEVLSLGTTTFFVDEDYLNLMNIQLLSGRGFDQKNIIADSQYGLIVNESFLHEYGWGDPNNALGKIIEYFNPANRSFIEGKVIGVVKDFHFQSFHTAIEPMIIRLKNPMNASLDATSVINTISIKADGNAIANVIGKLKQDWKLIDSAYPLEFEFLDNKIQGLYERDQKLGVLFIVFSLLSILITCLGLLGIALLIIEQRIKEIGIRKILGATPKSLAILFSRSFLPLLLISFILATPFGYWVMEKWLENFSYRVNVSVLLMVVSGVVVSLLTLVTVAYQSIKASNMNPVDTLRAE